MTRKNTTSRDEIPTLETDDGTYTGRYDWDGEDTPASAIVQAVAAVRSTDPASMRPLYAVVDTDAVNRLFDRRPGTRPDRLSVRYERCEVTVYGDGRVVVAPSG